ncbi:hypothetical protein Tco_0478912 [Tanacetum coccineum]
MWWRGGGVGSISGVSKGKVEFMGGIGGGSFANRLMVAKDGLGGDGFLGWLSRSAGGCVGFGGGVVLGGLLAFSREGEWGGVCVGHCEEREGKTQEVGVEKENRSASSTDAILKREPA